MRTLVVVALAALVGAFPASTAAQPDPSQMSGVPLPVGDMEPGAVTVRVIRGSFANPVPSLTVELTGGPSALRAVTDGAGRAAFSGLAPGTRVKAAAVVGGERLESQEFAVPAAGGIRLMLVASAPPADGAGPAQPAVPGRVELGEESRFIFEMGEDGLSVFYVLQIVNQSGAPVQPDAPLVFDLPADARRASLLEGSSPQGSVAGRQLTVTGPFAPGSTVVQVGYTLPVTGPDLVIEQRVPVALAHVAVVAQKLGDMQLSSPQIAEQRTMPAQGNLYIAARGGPVPAGTVMRFAFANLPHHPAWPRHLALGLAVLLLAAGAWASITPGAAASGAPAGRRQLEARRDRLFDDLTALETRHREGAIGPDEYAERRRALVAALERVYAALDEPALGRAS